MVERVFTYIVIFLSHSLSSRKRTFFFIDKKYIFHLSFEFMNHKAGFILFIFSVVGEFLLMINGFTIYTRSGLFAGLLA